MAAGFHNGETTNIIDFFARPGQDPCENPGLLERLKESHIRYEVPGEQLEQSDEPQISTTDPDARALLIHGQVVEVSYNTQTAVDEKHKLVVATHTINRNDRNAFSAIAPEAAENIGKKNFTALVNLFCLSPQPFRLIHCYHY